MTGALLLLVPVGSAAGAFHEGEHHPDRRDNEYQSEPAGASGPINGGCCQCRYDHERKSPQQGHKRLARRRLRLVGYEAKVLGQPPRPSVLLVAHVRSLRPGTQLHRR